MELRLLIYFLVMEFSFMDVELEIYLFILFYVFVVINILSGLVIVFLIVR